MVPDKGFHSFGDDNKEDNNAGKSDSENSGMGESDHDDSDAASQNEPEAPPVCFHDVACP